MKAGGVLENAVIQTEGVFCEDQLLALACRVTDDHRGFEIGRHVDGAVAGDCDDGDGGNILRIEGPQGVVNVGFHAAQVVGDEPVGVDHDEGQVGVIDGLKPLEGRAGGIVLDKVPASPVRIREEAAR